MDVNIKKPIRNYTKINESDQQALTNKELINQDKIDLASISLNYERFKELAQNHHLSSRERIGFPENYRENFEDAIIDDIAKKLEFETAKNASLLDIGCGASPLTHSLLKLCYKRNMEVVLNDSQEMLTLIGSELPYQKVAGKFPDILERCLEIHPEGYTRILCYSVLHYIIVDGNIFDFIDSIVLALKPGGIALVGDIPNRSKRQRFFASSTGIAFHKDFMRTTESPIVDHYTVKRNSIDDAVLNALVSRAQAAGCDAYIVPQPNALPMANRRDDLLIKKL